MQGDLINYCTLHITEAICTPCLLPIRSTKQSADLNKDLEKGFIFHRATEAKRGFGVSKKKPIDPDIDLIRQ